MRSDLLVLPLLLVACSSTPTASTDAQAADVTYYSGDGNVYEWNDAAGPCQPAATAGFMPMHITPVVNPVCTDAQIQGVVTSCYDPSLPDNTACTAWKAIPANQACLDACPFVSDVTATSWGPLVRIRNPGTFELFDIGACIAMADPSAKGLACADALNAQLECEAFACTGGCPIPTADSGADSGAIQNAEIAFQSCTFAADSGPCAAYVTAVNECVPTVAAAATFCVDGTLLSGDPMTFDPAIEKLFGAQCGGAPTPEGGMADAPAD